MIDPIPSGFRSWKEYRLRGRLDAVEREISSIDHVLVSHSTMHDEIAQSLPQIQTKVNAACMATEDAIFDLLVRFESRYELMEVGATPGNNLYLHLPHLAKRLSEWTSNLPQYPLNNYIHDSLYLTKYWAKMAGRG